MTTAPSPVVATPGFATMVTAPPAPEVRSAAAAGAGWVVTAIEILFVGLLVPVGILVVGAPVVLLVRGIIALATLLVG